MHMHSEPVCNGLWLQVCGSSSLKAAAGVEWASQGGRGGTGGGVEGQKGGGSGGGGGGGGSGEEGVSAQSPLCQKQQAGLLIFK